jgi:hypothetical protein
MSATLPSSLDDVGCIGAPYRSYSVAVSAINAIWQSLATANLLAGALISSFPLASLLTFHELTWALLLEGDLSATWPKPVRDDAPQDQAHAGRGIDHRFQSPWRSSSTFARFSGASR